MEQAKQRSLMALASSMFIFGTIGIFRRYTMLPSGMLAMFRGYIGMLFLVIFILLKGEKIVWKDVRKNAAYLIVSGVFIALNWMLLFESYRYTSISTATLCYYMAPIFVILVSPFLLGEALTIRKTGCVMVALFGMLFVSGVLKSDFNGAKEWKGVLFGLGAAVSYTGLIICNKKMKEIKVYDKTILQLGIAAAALTPYVIGAERQSNITVTSFEIIMIVILGIVHTGIAYALYFGSMKALNAQTIALFSYLDPIVAILLSTVLLQEMMSTMEAAGAVLILGATVVSEIHIKK